MGKEGAPVIVDVRGLTCSDAVVRLHRALVASPKGTRVVCLASQDDVVADLRKYAARSGHAFEGPRTGPDGAIEVEVRKGE